MNESSYTAGLFLAAGALLAFAVLAVWCRRIRTFIRLLVLQGLAAGTFPIVIGSHTGDTGLIVVGVAVMLLRSGLLPWVVSRSLPSQAAEDDQGSAVNVTAALLAVAVLTSLAYAVCKPVVALDPSPSTRAAPAALAVIFTGLFVLITRRHAIGQLVGFIVLDNGIAAFAFLLTAGFPLVVELGASTDVLLAVLVLQVLTARMRLKFGGTDLDQLRQLRD
jgi:hydrogenase-4 component E